MKSCPREENSSSSSNRWSAAWWASRSIVPSPAKWSWRFRARAARPGNWSPPVRAGWTTPMPAGRRIKTERSERLARDQHAAPRRGAREERRLLEEAPRCRAAWLASTPGGESAGAGQGLSRKQRSGPLHRRRRSRACRRSTRQSTEGHGGFLQGRAADPRNEMLRLPQGREGEGRAQARVAGGCDEGRQGRRSGHHAAQAAGRARCSSV